MTTNSNSKELKPCPMCGGKPIIDGRSDDLLIRCEGCGLHASSFEFDPDSDESIAAAELKAVEGWNTRTAAHGEQSNDLFVELREALRWALNRIETSNIGQGELFRKADDVLVRADADNSGPDEGAVEIGCGNCGWEGKIADTKSVVPLGHPISHHECPKCGKFCTSFFLALEPLAGNAEQVSERETPYWLCCGSFDPSRHDNLCIEAAAGRPYNCLFGTKSEHRAALQPAPERKALSDDHLEHLVETIWMSRTKLHDGELMPQLVDFARALLAAQASAAQTDGGK